MTAIDKHNKKVRWSLDHILNNIIEKIKHHPFIHVLICLGGVIIVPTLGIVAILCSVLPVAIFMIFLAGLFFNIPLSIEEDILPLNFLFKGVVSFFACLAMLLLAALSWKILKFYLSLIFRKNFIKDPLHRDTIARTISIAVPVLLLSMLIAISAMFLIDKYMIGSYYTNVLFNLIASRDRAVNLLILPFDTQRKIVIWIAATTASFLSLRIILKLITVKKKNHLLTNMIRMVINIAYVTLLILLVSNGFIYNYVNKVYNSSREISASSTKYANKFSMVKTLLKDNKATAKIALEQIISDFDNQKISIDSFTYEERLKFCQKVNILIEQKGGPSTPQEHYLRNKLNFAPLTLTDMMDQIKSPINIHWKLMTPSQASFHMYGIEGIFNLKFLSSDGLFEAVYNKEGILLTDKNDPINMGTYNYVDSNTQPEKHAIYDIAPYFLWGNVPNSSPVANESNNDNLSRFEKNPQAVDYYNHIKSLVG